jgi:uncharacterized protein
VTREPLGPDRAVARQAIRRIDADMSVIVDDPVTTRGSDQPKQRKQPMPTITRRGYVSASAAALAMLLPTLADAQSSPVKNKVVFQVSDGDPQKWNLALNNANNLKDDLGSDNVALEIVAYGPGIGMLKSDSPVGRRIAEALKDGVKIVACENTMKAQMLVPADMLPAIGYVRAGVVELMKRQQDGYAYIRP